jgi:hypothetical protein
MEHLCGSLCSQWLCRTVCRSGVLVAFVEATNRRYQQVGAHMLVFKLGFGQLLLLGQFC